MAQNENKKVSQDKRFDQNKTSYSSSQKSKLETPEKPESWQSNDSDISDTDEDDTFGTTQSSKK